MRNGRDITISVTSILNTISNIFISEASVVAYPPQILVLPNFLTILCS